MSREDFIENVRSAAVMLDHAEVLALSPRPEAAPLLRKIQAGAGWLSARSVEGFDLRDFVGLRAVEQDQLRGAVTEFLSIAKKVDGADRATVRQLERARDHLVRIVAVVKPYVLANWLAALEDLSQDVEKWATGQNWMVKREMHKINEYFLGVYHAPRLLIHSSDGRLLLQPISRFVIDAEGLVELSVMPSYESARIVRLNESWHLQPLQIEGRRQKLSEKTFLESAGQLFQSA
jgi:hypothetical protein